MKNPHIEHLLYIIRHKWYVFIECCKLGIPWQGITHDLSKFSISEWQPYVNTFFKRASSDGYYSASQVSEEFDKAWLHHVHHNAHHWQYYVLPKDDGSSKLIEMPERYVREMVADWRGASRTKFGRDNTLEWYSEHRDQLHLHPRSRILAEIMIQYWRFELDVDLIEGAKV